MEPRIVYCKPKTGLPCTSARKAGQFLVHLQAPSQQNDHSSVRVFFADGLSQLEARVVEEEKPRFSGE